MVARVKSPDFYVRDKRGFVVGLAGFPEPEILAENASHVVVVLKISNSLIVDPGTVFEVVLAPTDSGDATIANTWGYRNVEVEEETGRCTRP